VLRGLETITFTVSDKIPAPIPDGTPEANAEVARFYQTRVPTRIAELAAAFPDITIELETT
jgi:hypothetical protein